MTPEELRELAEKRRAQLKQPRCRLNVCLAAGCQSCAGDSVFKAIKQQIEARKLDGVQVRGVGCLGLCAEGPLVLVEPSGLLYQRVKPEDAGELLDALEGAPLKRLECPTDVPFFRAQKKIVLENAGVIDPENLEDYLAAKGYEGLIRALTDMTPADVIAEVTTSGLRGRGGGGYPTGLKWSTVAKSKGAKKYVICNGDEGDPGAFMDRAVLESDPHRVIEGMIIAAYAVGAQHGYAYIRAEYPLAVKRMQNAIKQAQKAGLLGDGILGTSFSFNMEVRLGAGAFVCGEETALIASIEGKRGQPRPRPPFPAESGLWGYPTLINNVETFANIPPILRHGGAWYAAIGTEKSKGTKVFALAGRVKNTGLIEVPMGITLREIIFDIGGGIPDGKKFKAVQTGGPSGGCIPEQYLDMPVDYDSLARVGSIMGSGGMIVMDETSCMVDVAKFFMDFCKAESCGKCVPCRAGTDQMHGILTKICNGEATLDDLALLERLCDVVKNTSLCGLGQTAPNPVLSTLKYFRDEYLAHIVDKRCPAGVCKIKAPAEVHA
ncbi:MAG: NADH-quinone oxidoreductase subunit NuoF [Kiritimatiellae bacterium]|nr:NADH-quinone oxidoreductase subunit NuoF [Kiritimatiellia bacterium]MDW8457885.1 NADH-quinone oxidoreductase subunit NuoF [Verrucomicrobiota bacterium]